MLERYLIEHCSPTLASIKTANLFNMPYKFWEELEEQLTSLTQQFAAKGISFSVVRRREGTALIYVYRRQKLKEDRSTFLRILTTPSTDLSAALSEGYQRTVSGSSANFWAYGSRYTLWKTIESAIPHSI